MWLARSEIKRIARSSAPASAARVSAAGAEKMRKRYHERRAALAGKPYGRAPRFEAAYLTDLLNDLIESGETMHAAFIDGGWREIDTVEDLARARAVVDW